MVHGAETIVSYRTRVHRIPRLMDTNWCMICDKQTNSELYCSLKCLHEDLSCLGKNPPHLLSSNQDKDTIQSSWEKKLSQASSSCHPSHNKLMPPRRPLRRRGLSFAEELRWERQQNQEKRRTHHMTSPTIST